MSLWNNSTIWIWPQVPAWFWILKSRYLWSCTPYPHPHQKKTRSPPDNGSKTSTRFSRTRMHKPCLWVRNVQRCRKHTYRTPNTHSVATLFSVQMTLTNCSLRKPIIGCASAHVPCFLLGHAELVWGAGTSKHAPFIAWPHMHNMLQTTARFTPDMLPSQSLPDCAAITFQYLPPSPLYECFVKTSKRTSRVSFPFLADW